MLLNDIYNLLPNHRVLHPLPTLLQELPYPGLGHCGGAVPAGGNGGAVHVQVDGVFHNISGCLKTIFSYAYATMTFS